MPQKFKTLKNNQVFYDPVSRAFFKKRDANTAAMLHHGVDRDFEGDAFDSNDDVQVVDLGTLPALSLSTELIVKHDCLEFKGNVADALVYLDELDSNNKEGLPVRLADFVTKLRTSIIDVQSLNLDTENLALAVVKG